MASHGRTPIKWVHLKEVTDSVSCISSGRSFQSQGALMAKARYVCRRTQCLQRLCLKIRTLAEQQQLQFSVCVYTACIEAQY